MTGRQNEYFIPGDGISREVIQADICRYLGNDALVRPGNHNGRPGFFIRAYRNLTSEMIADLKADSARWEADVSRRADLGYPRANYAASSIHEDRQQQRPSPPTFPATPATQPYMEPYTQGPFTGTQNAPYSNSSSNNNSNPSPYGPSHSPYGSGHSPYPPPQVSYSAPSQPVVTAADIHPGSYTYSATGFGYEGGRNAPRYPGPGYDDQPDFSSPVTSGMAFPASTAPEPRIGLEPRFTPEYERSRPQPTRERDPHRRR